MSIDLLTMVRHQKHKPGYELTQEKCSGGDHLVYRGRCADSPDEFACGGVVREQAQPLPCRASHVLYCEALASFHNEKRAKEAAYLTAWDDAIAENLERTAPERAARKAALDALPFTWRVYRAFPDAEVAPWQDDDAAGWVVPCPEGYDHDCHLSADGLRVECIDADWCGGAAEVRQQLGSPDLAEFMAAGSDEDRGHTVVPGLMVTGDRLILTGGEGHGKSTLARQIALQVACGVHPFTLEAIEPRRVLYVDLEVGARYTMDGFKAMGRMPERGMLQVQCIPAGVDLANNEDWQKVRGWADGCELVVLDPMWKLTQLDLADDAAAKLITGRLDVLRQHAALVVVAHQPHANGGQGRTLRPYGSSAYLRWPEFGLHLAKDGSVRHWRASRCPDREWPESVARGGVWPWTVPADSRKPWERLGVSRAKYYRDLSAARTHDTE